MTSVDVVVRAAVKEEVDSAIASLKSSFEEQLGALGKSLEERIGQVEDQLKTCQDATSKSKGDIDESAAQIRSGVEELCDSLRAQMKRLHSDDEGPGGLEQVRERLDALSRDMSGMDGRLLEQGKAQKASKGRLDEVDDRLLTLTRSLDAQTALQQKQSSSIAALEATSGALQAQLQDLDERWSSKHETLWQDVHRAVEEVRSEYEKALVADLAKRKDEMKHHAKSHTNYVTQLLSAAHKERYAATTRKSFFEVWRDQAQQQKQRQAGLTLLATMLSRGANRRQGALVQRWRHVTAMESMKDGLKEQYQAQIPDVQKIVGDSLAPLESKVSTLADDITSVKGSVELKSDKISLQEVSEQLRSNLQTQTESVAKTQGELEAFKQQQEEAILQAQQRLSQHATDLAGHCEDLEKKLEERTQSLEALNEKIKLCATSEQLQGAMKDVLMVWNSMKQLDAAKADKSLVDAFALELSTSCQQAADAAKQSEAAGSQTRQEAIQAVQSCKELQVSLEASTNHWQAMWDRLASLVEETVAKVATLQVPPKRPSSASRANSPVRETSSRAPPPKQTPKTRPQHPPSGASTLENSESTAALYLMGSPMTSAGGSPETIASTTGSFPAGEVKVGRLRPSSASRKQPRPSSASTTATTNVDSH